MTGLIWNETSKLTRDKYVEHQRALSCPSTDRGSKIFSDEKDKYMKARKCATKQRLPSVNTGNKGDDKMIETLITEKELCEWLKVSRATVGKMRRRDLPHYQIGSMVHYSKEEVQKWLEKHQHVLEEAEGDCVSEENADEEDHEGQEVDSNPEDIEFVWEEKGCRE